MLSKYVPRSVRRAGISGVYRAGYGAEERARTTPGIPPIGCPRCWRKSGRGFSTNGYRPRRGLSPTAKSWAISRLPSGTRQRSCSTKPTYTGAWRTGWSLVRHSTSPKAKYWYSENPSFVKMGATRARLIWARWRPYCKGATVHRHPGWSGTGSARKVGAAFGWCPPSRRPWLATVTALFPDLFL